MIKINEARQIFVIKTRQNPERFVDLLLLQMMTPILTTLLATVMKFKKVGDSIPNSEICLSGKSEHLNNTARPEPTKIWDTLRLLLKRSCLIPGTTRPRPCQSLASSGSGSCTESVQHRAATFPDRWGSYPRDHESLQSGHPATWWCLQGVNYYKWWHQYWQHCWQQCWQQWWQFNSASIYNI